MLSKEKRMKNRKKVEEYLINKFLLPLDPSQNNANFYKEKFKRMSNEEFDKWMLSLRDNFDENIRILQIPYQEEIINKNIQKTAKIMNVELFERVALPFVTMDKDNIVWSRYKVPVGWVHLKKVQQMVGKKNGMSIHTDKRDPLTGQATRDDKNGRVSDMENIALIASDLGEGVRTEFLHPKADNMVAKNEMTKRIKSEGRFSIKDLNVDKRNSTSLNTLDVYFLAAGIKTNLITGSLALKSTVSQKKGPSDYGVKVTDK